MRMSEKDIREAVRRLGPRAQEALDRAPRVVIPPGALAATRSLTTRLPGAPSAYVTAPRPGLWVVTLNEFQPANKNLKAGGWRKWHRARKRDDAAVAGAAGLVPPAAVRRLVRFRVTTARPGPLPDPQNLVESLADSLVNAGLLVDDTARWCRVETPSVVRGAVTLTVVEIEDDPGGGP